MGSSEMVEIQLNFKKNRQDLDKWKRTREHLEEHE